MKNSETTPSQYLLLFRGNDWQLALSLQEIQEVMGRWSDWFDRLTAEGTLKGAQPLEKESKVVSGKTRSVADGPFAEAKETIAGYFLVEVADIDAAVAIARDCPAVEHGLIVEVRPVAPACPAKRMAEESKAAAMA